MYLRRRIAQRRRLGRRRQHRAGPCRRLDRMDLRRRRLFRRGRFGRCAGRVARHRRESRFGLRRGPAARRRILRQFLAPRCVHGIEAGIARPETGRTAIDRRRAKAGGRGECAGGKRSIPRRRRGFPWLTKARRVRRVAVERGLQKITPRTSRLRQARHRRQPDRRGKRDAGGVRRGAPARQERPPRTRAYRPRCPRHPGSCQSQPPSRNCAGARTFPCDGRTMTSTGRRAGPDG